MNGWIAAAVLATAAAAAALWLLRSRPWRGPRTRYPVVLVHGILGFDEIGIAGRHDFVDVRIDLGVVGHDPATELFQDLRMRRGIGLGEPALQRRIDGRRTVTLSIIPPEAVALETGVGIVREDVLAFCSAKRRDGGTGAVYVLLRNPNKGRRERRKL